MMPILDPATIHGPGLRTNIVHARVHSLSTSGTLNPGLDLKTRGRSQKCHFWSRVSRHGGAEGGKEEGFFSECHQALKLQIIDCWIVVQMDPKIYQMGGSEG